MKKIMVVGDKDILRSIGNLMAIHIVAVAHELGLEIEVKRTHIARHDGGELTISYPESEWQRILEKKEEVRTALARRGDILYVRKIMRLIYATTVEEP